jgi:soluble lytic murein transglycosylase-like protein
MPRNITVTLANGATHTYQNAPDDITPDAVAARAQQEFGQGVTAIDGGRGRPGPAAPPASAPVAKPTAPAGVPAAWSRVPKEKAAAIYDQAQQALLRRIGNVSADDRAKALTRFNTDPRMQAIRQVAGLVPVATREEGIRAIARSNMDAQIARRKKFNPNPDASINNPNEDAAAASASRALFGLPERADAAIRYYLGGPGGPAGRDYKETLDISRAENDYRMSRGNFMSRAVGTVTGSIAGGGPVGGLVRGVGARLAATGAPLIAKAGNVLQELATLKQGQKLLNTGKVVAAGAAGGATQAAGEGSDVGEGALYGAVAPLVLGAGVKTLGGLIKVARQGTRPFSRSTGKAIREVVSEAPEAIAARHADLSARTGDNVPLVAALNDADFKAVTDRVLKKSPDATEVAKKHTGGYLRSFMDRMLGHVNAAGKTGDAQVVSGIEDLARLRDDTATDLMQPIKDKTVDLTQLPLDDLERSLAREIGSRDKALAPRINQALKDLNPDDLKEMGVSPDDLVNARKLMTQWGLGKPVQASVKEMDNLRRSLEAASKSAATSNPANSLAYRSAAKTIRDFTEAAHPAYGQMVDTYAAQSRMMEGFNTAAAGKRITDIEDTTLSKNLRTPEGRVGMKAGELYRQREAVSGRPTGAIAAARDFASQGKLTRPASLDPGAAAPGTVTENLGDKAAAGLADASQAETQVLGRMLDADKLNLLAKNEDGALSPEEIVYGAFLGNAMNSTKARFLATLLDKLPRGFNKKVANNMAEMLFSRDPVATKKAMAALNGAGFTKQVVSKLMSSALPISEMAGRIAASGNDNTPVIADPNAPAPSVEQDLQGMEEAAPDADPNGEAGEDVPVAEEDSPYAGQLGELVQNEDPELVDLIGRVIAQESGGRQHGDDGKPLTSSAGAIGAMQVMPDTAPEAAQLAGVPYDENAYRNDPAYNKLLGIAYLSEMLRRYDGDVEKALAAYNAGQGRVDEAIGMDEHNWLAHLPAETQDYVQRIA